MPKKPQSGRKMTAAEDMCMTPPYAMVPIIRVLKNADPGLYGVFDPAAGTGNIVNALFLAGFIASGMDICGGFEYASYVRTYTRDAQNRLQLTSPIDHPECSFIDMPLDELKAMLKYRGIGMIVMNPPWSKKIQFIERCYEVGLPFAALVPCDTITTEKFALMIRRGATPKKTPRRQFSCIYMTPRVNFEMPDNPKGESANTPTMWYTHRMGLSNNVFTEIDRSITEGDIEAGTYTPSVFWHQNGQDEAELAWD